MPKTRNSYENLSPLKEKKIRNWRANPNPKFLVKNNVYYRVGQKKGAILKSDHSKTIHPILWPTLYFFINEM